MTEVTTQVETQILTQNKLMNEDQKFSRRYLRQPE
jgi:hypothetical protein